jgi:hypothetical protein
MSARTLRRTFATPFVVTLTACTVQSGPPPARPVGTAHHPGHGGPGQTGPSDPNGLQGRPDDRAQMGTASTGGTAQTDTSERRWTVSRQGGKCVAYTKISCPPNAICNPPPPTDYACTADLADGGSIEVVRWAGSATCQIAVAPANCPPEMSCNPPPPQQVACPK